MFVQSLDGKWELAECGSGEVVRAQVPGCVHLDLMRAEVIPDPFFGDNEHKVAWVHERDWEYSRTFQADDRLFDSDRIYLECDGLDTVAQVSLNGEQLRCADNMYVQHRLDVTGKLIRGQNKIQIRFASPVNYAQQFLEKDPLMSPGDSIPGSIFTLKSPSQWGWDWGPKLPTSGIWKSVRLAGYKVGRIEDVRVRQAHRGGRVTLNIEVSLERFRRASCLMTVRLKAPDGEVREEYIRPRGLKATCSMVVDKPKLWWPNGYGQQPLYKIEAVLKREKRELHSLVRTIGLRTLRLEQKKDDHGRSFTFVVNGTRIFAKGANWVPADQFPCRMTPERYAHLVRSAAMANMNMLRVWGGGIYEDERFYDLCDQHGILVWQDFMFSCAMYPTDKSYLENCRRDIEANIVRLRNRACLALWCGNNEVEWFLEVGTGGARNPLLRKQYVKLFHDFIPSIVARLDPDTTYWPSSPSSGLKPFEHPNSQTSGDGHYWEVWHGRLPFAAYREQCHRFVSEFGFESMPALETVRRFAPADELNMTSYAMECHQKNSAGNGLILYYLAQTFRFPKNFEMMCYVSQLLQAEAMRYGVEHWRRNRGRCMGTLYWQLNDCWPVASWSSIDYFGRWKALQYLARRFYAPILLSAEEDASKGRARLHVTNDTTKAVRIDVRWSLEKLDGTVLRKSRVRTRLGPEQNRRVADLDFAEELAGDGVREAVLVHELFVDGKSAGMGLTSFVPPKHLKLPKTQVRLQPGSDEQGAYLDVSSDQTALFVCVRAPGRHVVFSDNYFHLPAGRKVRVRPESEVSEASLLKARAFSLRDSY